jgi:hypothetical protein
LPALHDTHDGPDANNTVNDCLVDDFGLPRAIFDPAPANLGLSGGRWQVSDLENCFDFLHPLSYLYPHHSPSTFFEYIIYCHYACHGGLRVGWLMLGETWAAHIFGGFSCAEIVPTPVLPFCLVEPLYLSLRCVLFTTYLLTLPTTTTTTTTF